MKLMLRLAPAVALGGAVAWAFSQWLRPEHLFDLVASLSFCR
jgi:hypothetical protein